MTSEANVQNNFDGIKWLLAVVLIIAAIYGNHYFQEQASWIRALGVLAVIGGALFVASLTQKGKTAMAFARESRAEIRQVVWPTRQEAIRTTLVIMVFVIFVAFCLWGIDLFLGWVVKSLMAL